MSWVEIVLPGSSNCGNWKLGACLLMSGEGISCGSPPRLNTMKMANTRPRNSTRGISKYLFMLFQCRRRGGGCHCDGWSLLGRLGDFLLRERVTAIANSKGSAYCHEQRAAPNPIH